jgi:hypothetical protein
VRGRDTNRRKDEIEKGVILNSQLSFERQQAVYPLSREFEPTGRRFDPRWAFHRKIGQPISREKCIRM